MTDHELEQRLRDWYRSEIPDDETAPAALRSRVIAIPKASPAPLRRSGSRRGFTLLAAAALLTTSLVGGALIAGSQPNDSPSVVVPPEATSTSTQPSFEVLTEPPASSGLVAYRNYVPRDSVSGCTPGNISWFGGSTRPDACYRLWVSNPNGTGARELLPDQKGHQSPVAWSSDGTRLLFEGIFGPYLTDPSGSVIEELRRDCVYPCGGAEGFAFSPDGTQLAFLMNSPELGSDSRLIATMDLATRQITKLASTAVSDAVGGNGGPRWSPDGTRLIFTRGPARPTDTGTLVVVDVDGSNLHELGPTDLRPIDPQWSPDGSLIAFFSYVYNDDGGSDDIYVIRADGTDLRRLTTDGISLGPHWTSDGRLVFRRLPGLGSPTGLTGYEAWIMDADGGNLTELQVRNLAQLSAAKCLECPYLPDPAFPFIDDAVWQPVP